LGVAPDAAVAAINPLSAAWRWTRRAGLLLPRLYKVFVQLSLAHPRLSSEPYLMYDRLRAKGPIRKDPLLPAWLVTGYPEASEILRDARLSSDVRAFPKGCGTIELSALPPGPVRRQVGVLAGAFADMLIFNDDPRHMRLRTAVGKVFAPRNVAPLRDRVQQVVDGLLDRVIDAGRMDFIQDFAAPLPLVIVSDLMGFGRADHAKLKEWSVVFGKSLSIQTSMADDLDVRRAMIEMREYFDRIVAGLQARPDDSLLGQLVSSPHGIASISLDELFANCVFVLAAGHETTASVLGSGMLALAAGPEQMRRLAEEPSLIPNAVEEMLRLESPVQWTRRFASEDLQFEETLIPKGSLVLVSIGAANHDARQFPDPHRLKVTRENAAKNIAFSGGGHYCLGASLARIELQIAFETLLRRVHNVRVADGFKVKWRKGHTFRMFDSLPVTFETVTALRPSRWSGGSNVNSSGTPQGTTATARSD
jgi:cytochrome P450